MIKTVFPIIIILVLVVSSFAGKTMKVHTNSGVVEYDVSDIDSITFDSTSQADSASNVFVYFQRFLQNCLD